MKLGGRMIDEAMPDKRKHKRYPISDDTVVLCDSSIGSVLDISEGGLAIKYFKPKPLSDEAKALVFSGEKDFLVSELPVRVVRREEVQFSPLSNVHTQTVGVKFNKPNALQRDQIMQFIAALT